MTTGESPATQTAESQTIPSETSATGAMQRRGGNGFIGFVKKYLSVTVTFVIVALVIVICFLTVPSLKIFLQSDHGMTVIGLLVASGALCFAIKQFQDARGLYVKLQEVSGSIDNQIQTVDSSVRKVSTDATNISNDLLEIRKSMSTRCIYDFPKFVPDIVETIKKAKEEVVIVCDVPGYGYFSNHPKWLNYKQAIELLLEDDKKVTIICLDEGHRDEYIRGQFNRHIADWEEWKLEDQNRKNLVRFFNNELKDLRKESSEDFLDQDQEQIIKKLEYPNFIKYLNTAHNRVLQRCFSNAQIYHPPTRLSVYFWIADTDSAVFSIPTLGEYAQEIGFITSDTTLIKALKDQAKDLQDLAQKAEKDQTIQGIPSS